MFEVFGQAIPIQLSPWTCLAPISKYQGKAKKIRGSKELMAMNQDSTCTKRVLISQLFYIVCSTNKAKKSLNHMKWNLSVTVAPRFSNIFRKALIILLRNCIFFFHSYSVDFGR